MLSTHSTNTSYYGVCHSVDGLSDLYNIRASEQTVDLLVALQKSLIGIIEVVDGIKPEPLKSGTSPIAIDDSEIFDLMDATINRAHEFLERLKRGKKNQSISLHDKDFVMPEYIRAIELSEALIDSLTDLKVAIMEHDADADPITQGPFSSARDLI